MLIILGSGGFVGSILGRQMGKKDFQILCLDKVKSDKYNGKFKFFDQTVDRLNKISADFKTLIILSGISSHPRVLQDRQEAAKANVKSIGMVIEDFIEIGGEHVIFASSEWVYSRMTSGIISTDPRLNPSPYGRQKLFGEILIQELCEASKVKFTNLRFGIIWGSRVAGSAIESITSACIANNNLVEISHRKSARRFVHVEDIARAIIGAVENRPNGTFDIQGDKVITMEMIIQEIEKNLKINKIIINERDKNPDTRYLNENEIIDLPFLWRQIDFEEEMYNLIKNVHQIPI